MKPAVRLLSGLLTLAAFAAGSVQAADIGHARLASAAGQPLLILVPVQGLSEADLPVLSAKPAPAADWSRVGLTPPVALDTLSVRVAPGPGTPGQRVLRITSPQLFSGSLADLLLDVQTASGQQRYQVSLLAPAPLAAVAPPAAPAAPAAVARTAGAAQATSATSVRRVPQGVIPVRKGDTMFAIARRHAVDGVSVYQLMMALQRTNPRAFIQDNINLVRAGARLAVPSRSEMLSISDAEARRQFVAQTAALARLRGTTLTQAVGLTAAVSADATQGKISSLDTQAPQAQSPAQDQLRLSQGTEVNGQQTGTSAGGGSPDQQADAQTATRHAQADAQSRVGQLEDNVHHLNQALQAQGEAARNAAASGAQAITQSIQQIAGAITQASQDAAAQANAEVQASAGAAGAAHNGTPAPSSQPSSSAAAPGAASPQSPARDGQAGTTGATTSSASGSAATAAGQASTAPAGAGGTKVASGADSTAATSSGSAAAATGPASPPAGASGSGSSTSTALSGGSPVPGAAAEAAELASTPQAQHRASWIQDHLLGVMTGLLALIVFIIAWLLRRASAGRDDIIIESAQPTEAMVREKLQGLDLELTQEDRGAPPKG